MDITPIISAFIAILGVLLTSLFVPWLKRKFSAERYNQLQTWVRTFVLAAEQIYGAGNGRAKLEYVADLLRDKGIEVDIDDITDEVRAMIEAAVRELGDKEIKEKGIEVNIDDVEDENEIQAMIEAAIRELGDKEIKESDNAV